MTLSIIKKFTRNAKLFLIMNLFSGLGRGIWLLTFNLYILSLGFDISFLGLVMALEWLGHGGMSFPAGILGDYLGRKNTFIVSSLLLLFAYAIILTTVNPTHILLFAILIGVSDSFHAVVGNPFMMENSSPNERAHLFSYAHSLEIASEVMGYLIAGIIPIFLSPLFSGWKLLRFILILSIPLSIIKLIPIYFIVEKRIRINAIDALLLRNVVSWSVVKKMLIITFILGLGTGLFMRYFNVFFSIVFNVDIGEIAIVFAFGSVATAIGMLAMPSAAGKWGKVRSITIMQIVSVLFLFLIPFSPLFVMAGAFYTMRGVFMWVAKPIKSMFFMELLEHRERATISGLNHALMDIPMFPMSLVAAWFMNKGDFLSPFLIASLLYILAICTFYFVFIKYEKYQQR